MHAPHTAQPLWQRGVQIPAGTANAQLRCQKALEIIPGPRISLRNQGRSHTSRSSPRGGSSNTCILHVFRRNNSEHS
jgi:hypothetical protein